MSEAEQSARVAPRIAVRCETWREFAERYADDIASGGMYLSLETPPEVLSLVDVVLQLPEAVEISLRARVVHVLSADQAVNMGKQPGVGLELLDIDAERRRQVMQLIEFARWQGNDPSASFARTLLELSPAMAPSEVGYRLSMLPGASGNIDKRGDSRPMMPAQTAPVRAPSGPVSARAEAAAAALRRSLTPPGGRAAVRDSSAPPGMRTSSMPPARSSSLPPQPTAAGRASNTSLPAASARSTASIPATTAKSSRSGTSLPAVSARSTTSMPATAPNKPGRSGTSLPAAANSGERPSRAPEPPTPPKPTDKVKLKLVLTHVAHKHYEEAIRVTREMLESNPGDPEATQWQALSCARLALQRQDDDAAVTYYEQILRIDPEQREAREFVRTHQRDKKLNSIPFGRYFTTKKK